MVCLHLHQLLAQSSETKVLVVNLSPPQKYLFRKLSKQSVIPTVVTYTMDK